MEYNEYLSSIDDLTMWEFIEKAMDTAIVCPKLPTFKKIRRLKKHLENSYPTDENFVIENWIKSMDARHLLTDCPNFTELWWPVSPLDELIITTDNIKPLLKALNSLSIEAKLDSLIMLMSVTYPYVPFGKPPIMHQQLSPTLFEEQNFCITKEENSKLSLSKKIKFLSLLSKEAIKQYIYEWYDIKDITFQLCEGLNPFPETINERHAWLHSFIKLHSHKSQKTIYPDEFNDLTFVY